MPTKKNQDNWIDVKKKPEPNTVVLVWEDGFGTMLGKYSADEKKWWDIKSCFHVHPSHWQPLPEGPKKSN